MATTISKLKATLSLDDKKFKKGLDSAQKQTKSFGSGMAKLGGAIAAAFAVDKVIEFGKQMAELHVQGKNVTKAFERLDGLDLRELRAATGGAVSDMVLMQRSVMAVNLGLKKADLAKYFQFAAQRASETGESVDYLVNSIVRGIGRKSTMVMDNLGISAIDLQNEIDKVGDFATAAGNIIDREMAKSEGSVDGVTSGVGQLSAAWDNLVLTVAQSSGMWNNMAGELAQILNAFVPDGGFKSQFSKGIQETAKDIAFLQKKLIESGGLKYWQDKLDIAIAQMIKLQKAANDATAAIDEQNKTILEQPPIDYGITLIKDIYKDDPLTPLQNHLDQLINDDLAALDVALDENLGTTENWSTETVKNFDNVIFSIQSMGSSMQGMVAGYGQCYGWDI